ncbi:hypothetical protein ACVV2G_08330 [Streptomyces ziwulingensis]
MGDAGLCGHRRHAALRSLDRGWDRSGIRLVAHGTVVFAAVLLSARHLSVEMAARPWVFGPLLIMAMAMASVVHGYVRTTRCGAVRCRGPGAGPCAERRRAQRTGKPKE